MTKRFMLLTLFPEVVPGPLGIGITGRAISKGLLSIEALNIRDFATNKHKNVDDTPYGGGGGMVMKPEPLVSCIETARSQMPEGSQVVLMSPQGQTLTQALVNELAQTPGLIVVCGRYEGIDERVRGHIDRQVSVGDYVVSGGEIPALLMLDSVARQVPDVLGNPDCLKEESFQSPRLEYPQYTRPVEFRGDTVPDVLTSGNHAAIDRWRLKESLRRTLAMRPDLLDRPLNKEERKLLNELKQEDPPPPSREQE